MRKGVIRSVSKFSLVLLPLALLLLILPACGGDEEASPIDYSSIPTISLNSTAFQDNDSIPVKYTCSGQNISPPLAWDSSPDGTQTHALIVVDLDAGGFTHWVLFNLPPDINEFPEAMSPQGQLPTGALEGKNSFGKTGYGGPCPPSGKLHRYQFTIYAIDKSLDLTTGASKSQVLKAMQGHILAAGQLTGTYQK